MRHNRDTQVVLVVEDVYHENVKNFNAKTTGCSANNQAHGSAAQSWQPLPGAGLQCKQSIE